MTSRFLVIPFTLTIILTSSLLFSVQPMFGKMILPLLGGSANVWNTAMLFFQLCLLGGYAFAHASARLLPGIAQALLFILLIGAFAFILPFGIAPGQAPPETGNPAGWQLLIMATVVGGPFFMLSASAPTLQHWFSKTRHPDAHDPYFLYSASNIGSMGALLAYPFIIERLLGLDKQAAFWMWGYIGAIALIVICASLALTDMKKNLSDAAEPISADSDNDKISWKRRMLWLLLAFIPSSLMLGVTSFITTDIASTPLLWIVPLALYLLTFIIAFARQNMIRLAPVLGLQKILIILILVQHMGLSAGKLYLLPQHLLLFFVCALACHMNLANLRPRKEHLTEFYLILSIGGALGGIFNAIVAPVLFILPIEYTLILILSLLVSVDFRKWSAPDFLDGLRDKKNLLPFIYAAIMLGIGIVLIEIRVVELGIILAISSLVFAAIFRRQPVMLTAIVATAFAAFPINHIALWEGDHTLLHQSRNFYGTARVFETDKDEHILMHGTTIHGNQHFVPQYQLTPLSYYSTKSPLYDAINFKKREDGDNAIAIIGLGAGAMSCLATDKATIDFFEIDPEIAAIAKNPGLFTYLRDCPPDYEIILGDGRLKIADKPDNIYDIIVLDSFSSDNIPVHLITKEAVQIYLDKLKEDGILVFHISNKFLNLEPILARISKELQMEGLSKIVFGDQWEDTDLKYNTVHAFLMTRDAGRAALFRDDYGWQESIPQENTPLWTDKYSNILSVLGKKRLSPAQAAAMPDAPDIQDE